MQVFHFLAESERLLHDLVSGGASSENVAHCVRCHFYFPSALKASFTAS